MGLFKFTVKLNSTEISDMEQKELEDDLKLKQELEGNKQYRNLLTYNISEDNMDKFNNDYSSVLHMEYKNSNYFFCAEGCLEKFHKHPEKYLNN